jgi:phosphatidylglycerophosphatase A
MTDGPPLNPPLPTASHRLTLPWMLAHPARWVALGLGCGLAPHAPGTVGTLGAWLAFTLLQPVMNDQRWALLLLVACPLGVWACTRTARELALCDPGAIVWDEVVAFLAVLWLVTPTGFWGQLIAFLGFRFFDAVKPGPVAWADTLFKTRRGEPIGWRQGLGIMFDDAVAALCTLLVIAVWRFA